MKPMQNRSDYQGRHREDEMYGNDNGTGRPQPVGDSLFNTNRRFSSDYANFDTEHAADYQRHGDYIDEYNNVRQGYYRDRGTQAGNSRPSQHPDSYGNRYGRDGDYSQLTRNNEQQYNRHQDGGWGDSGYAGQQRSDASGLGESGYRSRADLAGYGGGTSYNQGASNAWNGGQGQYHGNASQGGTGGGAGLHRGKGPKGYVRSDERIREDISDRLRDDDHIDASEIDISVAQGEVVLSGTVDSRFEKRHAEDLADSVSGVRNVENRIRVKA